MRPNRRRPTAATTQTPAQDQEGQGPVPGPELELEVDEGTAVGREDRRPSRRRVSRGTHLRQLAATAMFTASAILGIPLAQHGATHLAAPNPGDLDRILTNTPTTGPHARVAYLKINQDEPGSVLDRVSCTGNLVGPDLILTAAHCLSGDGDQAVAVTALLGYHYDTPHRPDSDGLPTWTHTCQATQAWVADPQSDPYDPNDWALLRLAPCDGEDGTPHLQPVGDIVGWHNIDVPDDITNPNALYLGYPRTYSHARERNYTGALHEVHTTTENPTWTLYLEAPIDGHAFAKSSVDIRKGGSGGALLHPDGTGDHNVVGVLSFNRSRDATYFVKTTHTMADIIDTARTGELPDDAWNLTLD